jgi:hypothetical protein
MLLAFPGKKPPYRRSILKQRGPDIFQYRPAHRALWR